MDSFISKKMSFSNFAKTFGFFAETLCFYTIFNLKPAFSAILLKLSAVLLNFNEGHEMSSSNLGTPFLLGLVRNRFYPST